MLAYVPALLLALFALWSGTFGGGAGAGAAIAGQAALLLTALLAADDVLDPLRLGPAGRLLPAALWIAVLASILASPVARAGRVGVLLLPAFLLVPAAVARCLRDEEARRRGGGALILVLAGVALYALGDQLARGAARAAMPLGHHNLLAAWLVTLLPLALPPLRRPGAWRWAAAAAAVLGIAAVGASRSLLAAVALCVEAGLVLWWMGARRRPRLWVAAALLAGGLLALHGPRLAGLLVGGDLSARARLVYLEAAWRGFAARPLLGWGPGSAAWTAAEFLRPEPGVNPPSEVVADLHSLPAQALYELGATGALLAAAVGALFVLRRLRRLRSLRGRALDPWTAAGLIGLVGGGVTRLGASALAVPALPLAAAVAAGVALAAESATPRGPRRAPRLAVLAYAVAATVLLLPADRAHLRYDRALAAGSRAEAGEHLAAARRLDPAFPLYAARFAWLGEAGDRGAAREARRAAQLGRGLAPLWIAAGAHGAAAGEPWAEAALRRACALDPLAGLAPFHRLTLLSVGDAEEAAAAGARALLGAPQLAAATFWDGRAALFAASLRRLRWWPGVDAGWRREAVRQMRAAREVAARPAPDGVASRPAAALGLEMDAVAHLSPSLHAFRRRPWPAALAPVVVDAAAAAAITVPAATALATTGREALGQGCGAAERSSAQVGGTGREPEGVPDG